MGSESCRLPAGELYPKGFDDVAARFITLASGLEVRVVETGSQNDDPVVLVPGWGCDAWIFHDILPHLASSGFHAMAVELKGHGLSDKPDEPREYTSVAMRDHLNEIDRKSTRLNSSHLGIS